MNLDDLLEQANPSLAPRTEELNDQLNRVVDDAARAARPTKHTRRRVGLVALTTTLLVGGGFATATAEGWIPPIYEWAGGEQECQVQMEIFGYSEYGGEPPKEPWTYQEEIESRDAARAFLATYDFDAIDVDQAITDFREQEAETIASEPDPEERQPRIADDEVEMAAVTRLVYDELNEHLEERGMRTDLLLSIDSWVCE